jgi:hypothetical protein
VTGKRGRKRSKLLDGLTERRGFSRLKDEAPYSTIRACKVRLEVSVCI